MKRFLLLVLMLCFLAGGKAFSETFILDGHLSGTMEVTQHVNLDISRPLEELVFRFALPLEYMNRTVSQNYSGLTVIYDPQPMRVTDETDRFGNRFRKATWKNVNRDIWLSITYTAKVRSELPALMSQAPFPLKDVSGDSKTYLKPDFHIQSDSQEIISLSERLTGGCATEYCAVTAIMNFVADSIKYTHNPPSYDALSTLRARSGHCTNLAHISIALLRAAGIPARMVGGIGLKERWSVPTKEGNIVQSFGQGPHAWLEIYFPDLGWLSYDPQQSKQFTSTRHVKKTQGLNLDDIADTWQGTPYAPKYSSSIEERFLDDVVSLKIRSSEPKPKAHMLSNFMTARLEGEAMPVKEEPVPAKHSEPATPEPEPEIVTEKPPEPSLPEPVEPPLVTEPPLPEREKKPRKPVAKPGGKEIVFGNTEFPSLIDVYRIVGNKGIAVFDMETAEYVTSKYVYAQAFTIKVPMEVETISLAMKKFGGDGTVYIDLVKDEKGKPRLSGIRSNMLFLENIPRKPGYYWVDFTFPSDMETVLQPGKYWIIARHSGEVILNWFYTPRKLYGGAYDTRSTQKGYRWEDILNYDFIFKVRGRCL